MNHLDCLRILGLSAKGLTKEAVILAYRKACSKYHPDRNAAGLEMMKMINVAWESIQSFLVDGVLDKSVKHERENDCNYGDEINAAINLALSLGLNVEICGAWVWVSGDTRPHAPTLKENSFLWAPVKKLWYFRPKNYKSFSRGNWDIEKIRGVYGSETPKRKSYAQIDN